MSSDGTAEHGATTHLGEVFTGDGTEVHDGLVCVDASVIPMALGVNPFATITALAERSVEGIARKKGIEIDYETTNGMHQPDVSNSRLEAHITTGTLNLFGQPAHPLPRDERLKRATKIVEDAQAAMRDGIAFTEIMEGHIYIGDDIHDFKVAERVARGACNTARFFLSVRAWDTEARKHARFSAHLTSTDFSQWCRIAITRPCSPGRSPAAR